MAINAYVPFETFRAANPVLNHSSRVYLVDPLPVTVYDLRVSDAVLDGALIIYDLLVSDAEPMDGDTPVVGLSTSTLTFPTVVLGEESNTLTLTITNTGTGDLTITGISTSGDFSVESLT